MSRFIDLTGKRFGRWLVLSRAGKTSRGKVLWLCRCDCGVEKRIRGDVLRVGRSQGCGCGGHGMSKQRLYRIWLAMIHRCYHQNAGNYRLYGERGVTVCEEWKNDLKAFFNWAIYNGYDDNLSIDRIDNEKGYSPENCRWATLKEQARNKRVSKRVTVNGVTHCLAEWAEISGLKPEIISARLKRGWPEDKAVSIPVQSKGALAFRNGEFIL